MQVNQQKNILADKIAGCLMGGAVGDALGFTTENLSRQRIQKKFKRVTDYYVWPNHGYYTDDTQLTIMLAETLLEAQDFDAEIFRNKLARWWLVPPRLSGRSTKNAALKCLLHFKETGYNVPGSSGAMRAAPLGIFYRDNLDQLVAKTVECCKITHTNNSAIAGALTNASSVAYALKHETFDQSEYLTQLCEIVEEFDRNLSNRLQELPEILDQDEDTALGALLTNSSITGSPIGDITLTAVYAFLKFPNDFEKSVLFCVNAGWDTDTMAAINGNIAGAFNGLNCIPERWVERLENGYKGRDYILQLVSHLHDGTPMKKPQPFLDYLADYARNTAFISSMLIRKPMA